MLEFFKKLFAGNSKQEVEQSIEEIINPRPVSKFSGVVVGLIKEISKHPNADKLQLTKVEVGGGIVLDIVCGATNITVGQKVPCAMVGAKLPNGLEIKEAVIRGEKSFGMLCAEDELGLGESHAGIMILADRAEVGDEIDNYIK